MDTFDLVPHVRDLAIAYGLAVPIGWDREREENPQSQIDAFRPKDPPEPWLSMRAR
jgi:hypothetical protein